MSPKLLLFGNPLLDMTVQVNTDALNSKRLEQLLKKYKLEKNGQKEMSVEKLGSLIEDTRARYELYASVNALVPLHRLNNASPC